MQPINELRNLVNGEDEQTFVAKYPQPFLLCNLTAMDQTGRSFKTTFTKDLPAKPPTLPLIRITQTLLNKPELSFVSLEKSPRNPYADRIFVGRTPTNDIVLPHHSISKSHAFFECLPGQKWHLTDNGSRNGTQVIGQLLKPNQRVSLTGETMLVFGYYPVLFIEPAALYKHLHRIP